MAHKTTVKKPVAKPDTTVAKKKAPPPVAPAPTYNEAGTKSRAKPKKPAGEPKTPIGRLVKFVRGGYTKPKGGG